MAVGGLGPVPALLCSGRVKLRFPGACYPDLHVDAGGPWYQKMTKLWHFSPIYVHTVSPFNVVIPCNTLWCLWIGAMFSSCWGNFSLRIGLEGAKENSSVPLRAVPHPAPAKCCSAEPAWLSREGVLEQSGTSCDSVV